MYLKSLTLKGFKSFADRTHMAFDPGMTVVVGPNGSGKSNISDAILWVLGEQSAKQLRGQAMEDVVFAGSSARKPVGVAEVTLVLDNTDHTLPVDFSEVALTRRMYRSGESEYLVNGSPARLMDFQDILHDSGLGKDARSIISQGKLDEILMSRPEDRRALIEEAAGISKHKRRKERAQRRIDAMNEHLKEALRLQRDINRQLRPLEKQVEQARLHRELTQRADELEILLAVDDLRRLQGSWGQVEELERTAALDLERAQAKTDELQSEVTRLQSVADKASQQRDGASEALRRAQAIVERSDSALRVLDEKSRSVLGRVQSLEATLQKDEGRRSSAQQELEQVGADLIEARGEQTELRKRIKAADDASRSARDERRTHERKLEELSGKERSLRRDMDKNSLDSERARDALSAAGTQQETYESQAQHLESDIERLTSELQAAQIKVQDNNQEVADARDRESLLAQDVVAARQATQDAQRVEEAARSALSSAQAEAQGLRRAASSEENRTPLALRIASAGEKGAGIAGRVAEELDVPDDLAELVETLLADRMRGFVMTQESDLLDIAQQVDAWSDTQGQVALVLTDEQSREPASDDVSRLDTTSASAPQADDGLAGYALCERLGTSGVSGEVAYALLGDVRVVQDLPSALAASRRDPAHCYATPIAQMAWRGALAVVGRPTDAAHGILSTRRRIKELESSLDSLAGEAQEAAQALQKAQEVLAHVQVEHTGASSALAAATAQASALSGEVTRAQRALDSAVADRDQALQRTQQAHVVAQQSSERLEKLQDERQRIAQELEELQAQTSQVKERLDAIRKDERRARDEGSDGRLKDARLQERVGHLDRRYNQLSQESSTLAAGLDDAREQLLSLRARALRFEPLRASLLALSQVVLGIQQQAAESERDAADGSSGVRTQLASARESLDQARSAQARALEAVSDVKVTKGRLDVQVSNAVNAITQHKGVILEDALKLPQPDDRASDEQELTGLRRRIEALGPVNQVAFEQYDELRQRAEFVASQVEDLQKASGSVAKIMSAIDKKMRDGFLATFEVVDANFRQIFSTLFPGGSGYLELTVPDDPSLTGIEVIAQPKGKRVTKMSLLSGGERSLTALGLLFAVYRARTAPFFVLDEVEAALDDTNLDRLLAAMQVLRQETQLIVISHQRRTMEQADVLYGVSMRADGVSKVVSQRLEHLPQTTVS